MTDEKLLYKDLTFAIIGAGMEVHRVLGLGFLESVYEQALAHEFALRGVAYERQTRLTVTYKEIVVGEFRADFLVEGKVVVELKASKALTEIDEAQLLNYLGRRDAARRGGGRDWSQRRGGVAQTQPLAQNSLAHHGADLRARGNPQESV